MKKWKEVREPVTCLSCFFLGREVGQRNSKSVKLTGQWNSRSKSTGQLHSTSTEFLPSQCHILSWQHQQHLHCLNLEDILSFPWHTSSTTQMVSMKKLEKSDFHSEYLWHCKASLHPVKAGIHRVVYPTNGKPRLTMWYEMCTVKQVKINENYFYESPFSGVFLNVWKWPTF